MAEDFKPHLFLKNVHTALPFTTISSGGTKKELPVRNRIQHGHLLLGQLENIWEKYNKEKYQRQRKALPTKEGEYITVKGVENYDLNIDTLNSKISIGAELLNVKYDSITKSQQATIYIQEKDRKKLNSALSSYISKNRKDNGKPVNEPLVSKIDDFSKATFENLWTDSLDFVPKTNQIWVELWIKEGRQNFEKIQNSLKKTCDVYSIKVSDSILYFPERTIIYIKANIKQLEELVNSFDYIAEFRKPEELNEFWQNQGPTEQSSWITDLLSKIKFKKTNNFITILDTGVNNGHELLKPILLDENRLTADINWGVDDKADSRYIGHGTQMAGIAIYGDLKEKLQAPNSIEINTQLESVKIIPRTGINRNKDIPFITKNAVNIAITSNPLLHRIYCLAITGTNKFEFGKPTTWSATIDEIVNGQDELDKKLFLISAGNVRHEDDFEKYPENNLNCQVESPAQSWNSITVGAFTEKILPNHKTLALKGELSPFSRTSNGWGDNWPIKPEILFEGGNMKKLSNGQVDGDNELGLLTTSHDVLRNNFAIIDATSSATALCAYFMAALRNQYPIAWEETLRGLLIHSASWTEAMKKQLKFDRKQQSIVQMLRTYGYGVPNLEKALRCKNNYLTFISEETIQPYIKVPGKSARTNNAHYYEFPWPKEALENLGEKSVTLRVTLSYFIEPNPGEKGYSTKYSYQSAALKFSLIRPGESSENFIARTNRINKDNLRKELGLVKGEKIPEIELNTNTGNERWTLGADNTFKGSIHSNFWEGNAVEIASCNFLAVYPQATGWWKNLKSKKKFNQKLRYSLIVSIETPENSTDIYTEIAQKVKIENLVKV